MIAWSDILNLGQFFIARLHLLGQSYDKIWLSARKPIVLPNIFITALNMTIVKMSIFEVKNFTPKFYFEIKCPDKFIDLLLNHKTIIICQVKKEQNTDQAKVFK